MKKYASLLVFIPMLAQAITPTQGQRGDIDFKNIQCPTQDKLIVFDPTRIGQNKIRYWFGGAKGHWSPMAIDSTEAGPYTQVGERSAPQIRPMRVAVAKNNTNGDWTISCTYGAQGLSSASEGTTTLTVRAKTCTLNTATSVVSCE